MLTYTPAELNAPQERFRLTVEPMCGLCNRMRVLDGAISLMEELDGVLHVIWFSDKDLNCRFSDLFEPLTGPTFTYVSLPPLLERVYKRVMHRVLGKQSDVSFSALAVQEMVANGYNFTELSRYRRAFMRTWDRISKTTNAFSRFKPVQKLQHLINSQTDDLKAAVGVHIRRTDCTDAIAASTTEKFLAHMQQELLVMPETTFFLATDDPKEQTLLERAFPGKVRVYTKRSRNRNKREAIEDAVVDLYSLARCRKILGSYKSSFSETAIALNGGRGIYIT